MNLRKASYWALAAAVMFIGLMGYERLFVRPPAEPEPLLPGFDPDSVDSLQVLSANMPEKILVERTNGTWRMVQPISYPAQAQSIEALLQTLRDLRPATRISPAELRGMKGRDTAFGLDEPQHSLVFYGGEARQQLLIGSKTAPGDQVFAQLVGGEGVCVVDAALLNLIPNTANDWRSTAVFRLTSKDYDGITINANGQGIELRKDPTNHAWQILRPTPARADGDRLEMMLRALSDLRVHSFVTNTPQVDREGYGLQPPVLAIQFLRGTNSVATLQFGKLVADQTSLLYAVGLNPDSVVAVPSAPLAEWKAPPSAFRDRQLVQLARPVSAIEFQNTTNFSLRHATNGAWRIEPEGWPGDKTTIQRFIRGVDNVRVSQFVKDVVAEPDLPSYGLANPRLKLTFTFEPVAADQPAQTVQLEFGDVVDHKTYVRRADENAVYAVDESDLSVLPAAAGHFRDRRIWNFDVEDVASLTLRKGDKSWRILHNGKSQWTLGPESQGILNAGATEAIAEGLASLTAVVWTAWDEGEATAYGVDDASVVLVVELKNGTRLSVRFGNTAPSNHVYAGTTLDGKEWVFEFSSDLFDLIQAFLIKPARLF